MADVLPVEDVTSDVLSEIDASLACSQYAREASGQTELVEVIVQPTVLRQGKEAFLVFRYGSKRFKVTFEEMNRVRMPKATCPVS